MLLYQQHDSYISYAAIKLNGAPKKWKLVVKVCCNKDSVINPMFLSNLLHSNITKCVSMVTQNALTCIRLKGS